MNIHHSYEIALANYKPKFTELKLYKDQSIYCDIAYGKDSIAIGYNFHIQKIVIYCRNKTPLSMEIINTLNLLKKASSSIVGYIYTINISEVPENQRLNYYYEYIKSIESLVERSRARERNIILKNHEDSNGNNVKSPSNLTDCYVQFLGDNNQLDIDDEAALNKISIIFLGSNSTVKIGKKVSLFGTIKVGHNCHITIGSYVSSTNPVYITCAESTKIDIGDDCMFATNNQIRTDDAHPIYSTKSGKRINPPKDIVIEKHVWIGFNAVILGGARIGSGSVLGLNSLANKTYPNNCIIAGTPAKIIKTDIFWERPNVTYFNETQGQFVPNFSELDYCTDTILNKK